MNQAGPSDQAKRARTEGTAAGLFALSGASLGWVGGWDLVAGEVPTSAVVWWLVAWLVLALLGYPRGK